MTNLKRFFFLIALYLAVIFIFAHTDYLSNPIIDFASYFYVAVMVSIPVTLFFSTFSHTSVYVPVFVWAGVYMILLQTVDRSRSAVDGEFSVIVLEFLLLEMGVWLMHQLAVQIGHAESLMDALALSTFPNRAHNIDAEEKRIELELTRSRRYHRPLGLIVLETDAEKEKNAIEMLKGIQHDLMNRFTSARVGQIVDDRIRQTDLVMKDRSGRFIILCPETDLDGTRLLGDRIAHAIKERTDLDVRWGVAAFPEEALTFEDLLHKARERCVKSERLTSAQSFSNPFINVVNK